jgi:hypothetical protein
VELSAVGKMMRGLEEKTLWGEGEKGIREEMDMASAHVHGM